MAIQLKSVVAIHYILRDDEGSILDASTDGKPMVYLHGAGNIIPGLEKELFGKTTNDSFTATIPPEQGYGEHAPELIQTVPLDVFQEDQTIEVDMSFSGNTPQGPLRVVVTHIADGQATLDANHPMAGKTLHFEVTVDSVREANEEELLQGHPHVDGDSASPDGCGHQH